MSNYKGQLEIAHGYCDLEMWLPANEALEDIEPAEMRATVPVFILRERIYRALGNVDGADQIAAMLAKLRGYAESDNIEWTVVN